MRYRFIFGIWIAGALIAGFAMGEIMERDLFGATATQPAVHQSPTITTSDQDGNSAQSVFSRC